MADVVRPGHVMKFPFFTALVKVEIFGLKQHVCK